MPLSTLKDMLAVGGHVPVFRATRNIASALGCDATVTDLRACGALLSESEGVVHELTVTAGIDHATVHELLLALRRKVAGGASRGGSDR